MGRFVLADGTARPLGVASRRPLEPAPLEKQPFYRGWECGYEGERAFWSVEGEGYVAYKGGCDLDAPQVTARTWDELLDAVDAEEDEE